MHKTSYFNADEREGFKRAAEDEKLEILDLVSVRRSGTRLLRAGDSLMVRGNAMLFDDKSGIVYLKGTVSYFQVIPVPSYPERANLYAMTRESWLCGICHPHHDRSPRRHRRDVFDHQRGALAAPPLPPTWPTGTRH
jgi:hypothetical protein